LFSAWLRSWPDSGKVPVSSQRLVIDLSLAATAIRTPHDERDEKRTGGGKK